jgi:acetyl esterase/lipase
VRPSPFCRLLSEAAGVIVASVEYRLAPEHPYPAAVEDTLAAVHWAANNAAEWGGNPSRLALGGDSAGANLAAIARWLRATLGPGPLVSGLRAHPERRAGAPQY